MTGRLEVNINAMVRVRPTALGLQLLEAEIAALRQPLIDAGRPVPDYLQQPYERVDAEGFIHVPLWRVMQIFGPATAMGAAAPMETTFFIDMPCECVKLPPTVPA